MQPCPHTPSQHGLTLIEVMIAIVIMAIISLISWRALDSVSRSDAQLTQRTDATEDLLRTFQQLERDVALRATMELDLQMADETHDVPLLPPGLQVRRTRQLPFHLDIVRSAPAQPGQWQRVQWWWKEGTLFRAAGPADSRFPLKAPEPGDAVAVLHDVVRIDARAFMSDSGWVALPHAGSGTSDSAGGQAGHAASRPTAHGLEIQLVQRRNGNTLTYRRVFSLQ